MIPDALLVAAFIHCNYNAALIIPQFIANRNTDYSCTFYSGNTDTGEKIQKSMSFFCYTTYGIFFI